MSYKIKPLNRHLLVEMQADVEVDAFTSAFADSLKKKNEYEILRVVAASNISSEIGPEDWIVVPSNVIISFDIDGEKYHMVQENYIIATVPGYT